MLRKILVALILLTLAAGGASAQQPWVNPNNLPPCSATAKGALPPTGTPTGRVFGDDCTWHATSLIPSGSTGALQYNNAGVSGGLPLGLTAQVLHGNPLGTPTWGQVNLASEVTGLLPVGSVSGLGTAAVVDTGTSGSTIPLLSGVNTWSSAQTFSAAATLASGGSLSGLFSGAPEFTGVVILSGTPSIPNGAALGGTFSGTPTFSGAVALSGGGTLVGTFTGGAFTGGTIDNAVIGGTTRAAGSFTTLGASGSATLSGGGTLTGTFTGGAFMGGTINNAVIGGTTPAAGSFTTLGATGAATLSGGGTFTGTFAGSPTLSGAVTLSAAGTALAVTNNASVGGTLTINPSATNPLTVTNGNFAMTGTGNASYNFKTLGTGNLNFYTQGGSNQQFQINDTASSISWLRAQGGISGNGPTLSVVGDTAGKLNINSGSTGYVNIGGGPALNVSGGISYGKTTTYTAGSGVGPAGSANVAPLWFNGNYGGTLDTGSGSLFQFQLADSIVDSRGGPPAYFGWTHNLNAGYSGARASFVIVQNKNAASSVAANYAYQASNIFLHANVGDGGTQTTPLGAYQVINPDIQCHTGDWMTGCSVSEEDIRLYSGTNTPTKFIHAFHYGINDAVHAAPVTGNTASQVIDSAIAIDASPTIGNGSGKGITMIALGNWSQDIPWDTTAGLGTSVMAVLPNLASNLTTAGQAYIDNGFLMAPMLVRGKFIDNGNFSVSGTGDVVSGLATLAATSTGASLDITGVVEQSATVVSGGVGAKVGTELMDTAGGIWEVATLSGSAAATVTLKRGAAVSVCPSSPNQTVGFGMGQGMPTLNITCSSARNTLALQPSGGATTVGGTLGVTGAATAASYLPTPTVVASLGTCNSGAKGTIKAVTDALSPTWNATVAGGGAVSVPVYCNGTNWTVH